MDPLWKAPSAWVPMLFSLGIILMERWFVLSIGVHTERQSDEGAAAHLFQLWLVLEAILVSFFAAEWLPKNPRQASPVLLMQAVLIFAGCFPVFYFRW